MLNFSYKKYSIPLGLDILQTIKRLTNEEKILFYNSLSTIQDSLDDLVPIFYKFFLQTQAGDLFTNLDMEKQYKMFHVSLAILISYIDYPYLLLEHLQLIIVHHKQYGVKKEHIPLFIESFIQTLEEFIQNKQELNIWRRVITEIMETFQDQLDS